MNNLHRPWVEQVLEIAEQCCRTAKGYHSSRSLGGFVTQQEVALTELKRKLNVVRAIEYAVERWHHVRPGHNHDHLDDELTADALRLKERNHPTWTAEDYEELDNSVDRYLATHPLR